MVIDIKKSFAFLRIDSTIPGKLMKALLCRDLESGALPVIIGDRYYYICKNWTTVAEEILQSRRNRQNADTRRILRPL